MQALPLLRRAQMPTDDPQAQDLGARRQGQPRVHRFGSHHTLSEAHQQARLAWHPARAQVAVPVALTPEDHDVSCHVEAEIIAERGLTPAFRLEQFGAITRSRAREETGRAGLQVAAANVGVPEGPRPHRRRGSSRRRSPAARIATPAPRTRHTSGTAASAKRPGPGRPWRCAGTTSTSVPRETHGMAWDRASLFGVDGDFRLPNGPLAHRGVFL